MNPTQLVLFAVAMHMAVLVTPAAATTTICDDAAARKYDYGPKVELKFELKPSEQAAFHSFLEQYGDYRTGLSMRSGGESDCSGDPLVCRQVRSALSVPSLDFYIVVKSDIRTDISRAELRTFSFACKATEDWKPYWREFKSIIAEKKI